MAINRDTPKDTLVRITTEGSFKGAMAKLLRVTDTGTAVIVMLEVVGAYKIGDTLHVGLYELERA